MPPAANVPPAAKMAPLAKMPPAADTAPHVRDSPNTLLTSNATYILLTPKNINSSLDSLLLFYIIGKNVKLLLYLQCLTLRLFTYFKLFVYNMFCSSY